MIGKIGRTTKGKKTLIITAGSVLAVLLLLAASFFIYVSDYYHADGTAAEAMSSDDSVTVRETEYGVLFDGPSDDKALIFYPGGKVDETAYAPLLHKIAASGGIDVCLMKMPCRLAVLDANAADKAFAEHKYSTWYIGGHSLGGVMAAKYASSNSDKIKGVIMLSSYPSSQMPAGMDALLITASEDQVINKARLKESRRFLPGKYTEVGLKGGNHSQFGNYGHQKNDGRALISSDEQQEKTAEAVINFIFKA